MKMPFRNKYAGKKGNDFKNPRAKGPGSMKRADSSQIAKAVKASTCRG